MLTDRYDNPLEGATPTARDLYDGAMDAVLAGDPDMVPRFESVSAEAPDLVLGQTGLARARQISGDMPGAKAALAAAKALAPPEGSREALHITVTDHMLGARGAAAHDLVRAHVAEHPRDAMMAQLCCSVFGLIGFSGRPGREAELEAYTAGLLPHYGEDWWMLSQHAFSLCETGQTDAADAMIDRALALRPRNSHGAHVRSHIRYEAGETEAGLAYLRDWLTDLDRGALMHGHLSWHVALWTLECGDVDTMWAIVDADVAPGAAQGLPINVLTDSASILARAELAGHAVAPERWQAVSAYARKVFPETGLGFVDAHAAIAHAMAGDGAALTKIVTEARGPWAEMVRDLAEGFAAMARQDWAEAEAHLSPALDNTAILGGSRAQRDLLEFAYLSVLLKRGRAAAASRLLATRRPALAGMEGVAGLSAAAHH